VEDLLFASRWLLVPFYIGLAICIALLLVKFGKEFLHFVEYVFTGTSNDVVIGLLTMIDVVLLANLLIIIIFAGYENFVSKIDTGGHEDRPDWMGHVSFSDLKMKLIGSIVAISGIELLKAFVDVQSFTTEQLAWKVGIHLTFVISGLLFAVSDWLTHSKH
jgi:uncharacterized protein (TIGR00645 family)